MIAIVSLLVALTLSLIIIRVGTMSLMLTGLSRESARFQSHSAFTGVGFTTLEAESVMDHPVRRHIVMALMVTGNIGMATAIAAMMVTLLDAGRNEQWLIAGGILAAGLFVLWAMASSRWVEGQLNRVIAFGLRRFTHLDVRDYVSLLNLSSGFKVSELLVERGDWLAEKTLVELGLAREGVLVLGIRRLNGNYIGAPSGGSSIVAGDTLVIYSDSRRLQDLDSRCVGSEGDAAHKKAAKEYGEYLAEVGDQRKL